MACGDVIVNGLKSYQSLVKVGILGIFPGTFFSIPGKFSPLLQKKKNMEIAMMRIFYVVILRDKKIFDNFYVNGVCTIQVKRKYFKSINSTLPGRSVTSIEILIRRIIVVESVFITDLNYCQRRFYTISLKKG